MTIDCDDCFLLTARAAETRRVVLTDDFDVIECPKHSGSHHIVSWVEGSFRGWFLCSCGVNITTEGFDSEERSMGALFVAHAGLRPDEAPHIGSREKP